MSGTAGPNGAPLRGLLARRPDDVVEPVEAPGADNALPTTQVKPAPPSDHVRPASSPRRKEPPTPAPASADRPRRALRGRGREGTDEVIEGLRLAQGPFVASRKQNATISLPVELLDTLRRYSDELSTAAGIEVPYRALVIAASVQFLEERQVAIHAGYRNGRL